MATPFRSGAGARAMVTELASAKCAGASSARDDPRASDFLACSSFCARMGAQVLSSWRASAYVAAMPVSWPLLFLQGHTRSELRAVIILALSGGLVTGWL